MKKVLIVALLAFTVTLTGCTEVENTVTDLQDKINSVTSDLTDAVETITDLNDALDTATSTIADLEGSIVTAETTITDLTTNLTTTQEDLDAAEALLTELQAQNAALEAELANTNTKLKNATARSEWATRKVDYDESFNPVNAEYCFGIFDEDWSIITPDDYSHNTGLKFELTVLDVQWGTEVFVKDSCGNYSEFIFTASAYGLYSAPAGFFEVGETYEVVLYKEVYFTVPQLGFLPAASMGDWGAYPEDLSEVVINKIS